MSGPNLTPFNTIPLERVATATPEEGARGFWFNWLCRKYVQRADERQRAMGLQYTEAETHDLAKQIEATERARGRERERRAVEDQMCAFGWARCHDALLGFIQQRPSVLRELLDHDPRPPFPSPDRSRDALAAAERAVRIKGLEEAAQEFLDCVQYDAAMEGPKFKGYNRSSLDRLREKYEAIRSSN